MKTWKGFLFTIIMILLTACAPQKIAAEAEAYQTRAETDMAVMNANQLRDQEDKLNAIVIQEATRQQEIKNARTQTVKQVQGWLIYWSGLTMTIVLAYVLISVGRGLSTAIEGSGQAIARKAMVQANLIYLDAKTGQFPQLLEYLGSGRYSLTDLNDHRTLMLDTRNEADLTAVRGAISVRHALVMANAARQSTDPTGMAMIQPLILDAAEVD